MKFFLNEDGTWVFKDQAGRKSMIKKTNNKFVMMNLIMCLRHHLQLPLFKMLVLAHGDLGWMIA
jgi:hypothetical protein